MPGSHRSQPLRFTAYIFPAVLSLSPSAEAHAHLMSSLPAQGATIAAPGDIKLRFSEAPLAMLSGVELKTASGAIVPVSSKEIDKTMIVVVPQHLLDTGTYTVKWHVVTADTHRTQGTFAFTVR